MCSAAKCDLKKKIIVAIDKRIGCSTGENVGNPAACTFIPSSVQVKPKFCGFAEEAKKKKKTPPELSLNSTMELSAYGRSTKTFDLLT